MIAKFLARFRRSFKIQRASQDYDIAELIIDHGNGEVFSLLISPNEIKKCVQCITIYNKNITGKYIIAL